MNRLKRGFGWFEDLREGLAKNKKRRSDLFEVRGGELRPECTLGVL